MVAISTTALTKQYGNKLILNRLDFQVEKGSILGLIGPNGAGKTTLIHTLLGLTSYQGNIRVLNYNPKKQRREMLEHMCFIADVAILPEWMTTFQALNFVQGVHPKFNRNTALAHLKKTKIEANQKIKNMSKGMVVQLHLALIMAIDVELLILDEPTLGLDILYRKNFYNTLMNEYHHLNRTIIITTHQIEEIESILTHIMMIHEGSIILDTQIKMISEHFIAIDEPNDHTASSHLKDLNPLFIQKRHTDTQYIFEAVDNKAEIFQKISDFGEPYIPSISDIFQAKILGQETAK